MQGKEYIIQLMLCGIELKITSQSALFYNIGDRVSLEVNISDPVIFEE